jgi:hypothetical protein
MRDRRRSLGRQLQPIAYAGLAFGSFAVLARIVWWCNRGFDFTDEGYYLVWIQDPGRFDASASQFGFVYHPLHSLFEGSIVRLRQANVVLTFLGAWLLADTILRRAAAPGGTRRMARLSVSAGLATASLAIFDTWLLTPSYNTLALQGVCITIAGCVLCSGREPGWRSGGVLVGIGGWVVFLAKPTSAAALAVLCVAYLLTTRSLLRSIRPAMVAGFALASVTIWAMDGSIAGFVERLRSGADLMRLLGAGHTWHDAFRIDGPQLRLVDWMAILVAASVVAAAILTARSHDPRLQRTGSVLNATCLLLTLACLMGWLQFGFLAGPFQGIIVAALPIAGVLTAVRARGDRMQHAALAAFLLLSSCAYAFGTVNNYWVKSSSVAVLWVLTGGIAAAIGSDAERVLPRLVPVAISAQLLTAALLSLGWNHPYRQPDAIPDQRYAVELGEGSSRIRISSGFGRYLAAVRSGAADAGFETGIPIIDLTGQSPGILYALRAESLGHPWLLGRKPGSNEFASWALRQEPCAKVGLAWVLDEPGGPRSLSPSVLSAVGTDLGSNYRVVAVWETAAGAGGFDERRMQRLSRPTRSLEAAVQSCLAARGRPARNHS